MSSGQPGTSTAAQAIDDRAYLFRLQILIIDGGLLVLRNYADQILTAKTTSLSACLANEKATINFLRSKGIITQVQYDVLFPSSGTVSTLNLDITLIVCLLTNLKCFGLNLKFKWNVSPAPVDTSIEADICRLKRHRNEISHPPSTSGIQQSSFKILWKEIKEILLRINSSSVHQLVDLKQTIKDFKSNPLEPKAEERIQAEFEKWKKAEENELDILKRDNKHIKRKLKMHATEVKNVKRKVAKIEEDIKSKDDMDNAMTEFQYQQRKQGKIKRRIDTMTHFSREDFCTHFHEMLV